MGLVRAGDYILAVFFSLFVCISTFLELPVCLGEKVSPTSSIFLVAKSYDWGMKADRVWVEQPLWSRTAVCMHATAFNVSYGLMALALLLRWNWIRVPAIAVCTAKLYAGALYMAVNLLDPELKPADPALFVGQSASYMLIPFLMIVRMYAPLPFSPLKRQRKAD